MAPVSGKSSGGPSVSAHLRQVAKSKRIDPEQFVGEKVEGLGYSIECPEELQWLWNAFGEVSRGRTSNGYGPNPMSWSEFGWWAQLSRVELLPWEFDTLRVLDDIYLKAWHDRPSTA